MTTYNVTVGVRVDDKKQLFAAALVQCTKVDGMGLKDAKGMLRTGRNIDVKACLQAILDPGRIPGCDILQSEVETCPGFD